MRTVQIDKSVEKTQLMPLPFLSVLHTMQNSQCHIIHRRVPTITTILIIIETILLTKIFSEYKEYSLEASDRVDPLVHSSKRIILKKSMLLITLFLMV